LELLTHKRHKEVKIPGHVSTHFHFARQCLAAAVNFFIRTRRHVEAAGRVIFYFFTGMRGDGDAVPWCSPQFYKGKTHIQDEAPDTRSRNALEAI